MSKDFLLSAFYAAADSVATRSQVPSSSIFNFSLASFSMVRDLAYGATLCAPLVSQIGAGLFSYPSSFCPLFYEISLSNELVL